ncbi:MAG: hypothetical protein ACPGVT_00970 [Maricaulaceae bacterium]
MKKLTMFFGGVILAANFGSAAFANSPDVYVVKFRADDNAESTVLDAQLPSAIAMAGANIEEVVIDTSTAAKWEKGAHEAFDRDIVPVFNKWVGLPGFAAIVDAKSKRVLGCVNSSFDAGEMAKELRKYAASASGQPRMSNASTITKTTKCPAAHNVDTGL